MAHVVKPGPYRRLVMVAIALGLAATSSSAPIVARAANASSDAGGWDLIFEKGNRRCRLFLHGEPQGGGSAIGMPPACHHAFPALASVASWTWGDHRHVLLRGAGGATVMDFAPDGTPALATTTADGDLYTLTPADPAMQDVIRQAAAATPPTVTTPAVVTTIGATGVVVERGSAKGKGGSATRAETASAPALPPVSPAQVAGHYAVLRQDRDTGCMVTLEPEGARAKLAPACRDQGIVVFDPTGWQLVRGELVLKAKRGHSTALTRRDERTWANAPERGAPLILKRL